MSPPQTDTGLFRQCPKCLRTIWANGSCPSCHPPAPPKEPGTAELKRNNKVKKEEQ